MAPARPLRAAPLALLLLAVSSALAQDSSVNDASKARMLVKQVKSALPNIAKFGYGGCCTPSEANRKGLVSGLAPPGATTPSLPTTDPETGRPATGVLKLGLATGSGRDGYVFIPPTYSPDVPTPLLVTLHGANKTAFNGMATLIDEATAAGIILVAPSSREATTWDMFGGGGYGADVAYINASIAQVADVYNVDRARLGVEGFSDGATYALSLGLANGKVFSHVIAFSPGGLAPPSLAGNPAIFVSQGTKDTLFPKSQAGDAVACQLVQNQYDVTYVPFPGGHEVPPKVAQAAVNWFLGDTITTSVPAGTCGPVPK
jgi:phospholipase/carboxylesterase